MQTIDIYSTDLETNATNLKNALEEYGSRYFDSYETDFTDENGEKIVNCVVNETAVVKFVFKASNGYMHIRYDGNDISQGSYTSYVIYANKLYVCEKAIALEMQPSYTASYGYPTLIICKKTDGNTAILFLAGNITGNTIISTINRGNMHYPAVLGVNRSTGECDFGITPIGLYSNSNTKISGFTPFSANDGTIVDSVYLLTNADYDQTFPFTYYVNDQLYTGVFRNVFAVKGT